MFFRAKGRQERGKKVRVGLGSPAARSTPPWQKCEHPCTQAERAGQVCWESKLNSVDWFNIPYHTAGLDLMCCALL